MRAIQKFRGFGTFVLRTSSLLNLRSELVRDFQKFAFLSGGRFTVEQRLSN